MELMVRRAEEKDIEAMAELDKICFTVPWSRSSFEQEILENELAMYLVAESGGQIIGYAGLWHILDEGHITNVAVHPDFRKREVGQTLVSTLIDKTAREGIGSYTLEVRQSNLAAIALYSKLGFKPGGIRRKYYEDNDEDAIIMWRTEK